MIVLLSGRPSLSRFLVSKGRVEEAVDVLVNLRGYDRAAANDEILELQEESCRCKHRSIAVTRSRGALLFSLNAMERQRVCDTAKVEPPSLMELLRNKAMRRPLMISIAMMYTQQLSGINAVFYYSTDFFKASCD